MYFLGISVFDPQYTHMCIIYNVIQELIIYSYVCHNCSIVCVGTDRTSIYVPKRREMRGMLS